MLDIIEKESSGTNSPVMDKCRHDAVISGINDMHMQRNAMASNTAPLVRFSNNTDDSGCANKPQFYWAIQHVREVRLMDHVGLRPKQPEFANPSFIMAVANPSIHMARHSLALHTEQNSLGSCGA